MKTIQSRVRILRNATIIPGLGVVLGAALFSTSSVSYATREVPADNTPAKIEELKADVIDRLLACESAGHVEDDAIIIYDNNEAGTLKGKNVWSLGQLQFKVPTIQHYVKLRDGKELTQKEAVLLALDTGEARSLATWVIFETDKGLSNWLNCANKLGLSQEVAVLKRLGN